MSAPPFPPWNREAEAAWESGQSAIATVSHEGQFWMKLKTSNGPNIYVFTMSLRPEIARALHASLTNFLATVPG